MLERFVLVTAEDAEGSFSFSLPSFAQNARFSTINEMVVNVAKAAKSSLVPPALKCPKLSSLYSDFCPKHDKERLWYIYVLGRFVNTVFIPLKQHFKPRNRNANAMLVQNFFFFSAETWCRSHARFKR